MRTCGPKIRVDQVVPFPVCQRFGSGSVINNLTQACNGSVFATVFTNHRFLTRFPVITVLTWTCVCLTFHVKTDVCRSGGHLFDISHLFDICPFVRHLLSGWVTSYWHPCLPFPSPFFLVPAAQQSRAAGQPPGTSKEPSSQQSTQQQPRRSPGAATAAQQEQPTSVSATLLTSSFLAPRGAQLAI